MYDRKTNSTYFAATSLCVFTLCKVNNKMGSILVVAIVVVCVVVMGSIVVVVVVVVAKK